ncbi:MAG: hypothetical protein WC521_06435 [Bdellovibrionales bacterium]|jgi:hypothetical protein
MESEKPLEYADYFPPARPETNLSLTERLRPHRGEIAATLFASFLAGFCFTALASGNLSGFWGFCCAQIVVGSAPLTVALVDDIGNKLQGGNNKPNNPAPTYV